VNEPGEQLDALARQVIGVAIEVHRELGAGFLESVYENAMAIELAMQHIPFQRQAPVSLEYKGQSVGEARLDLLVDNALVVELKAVDSLAAIHHAQVINYLKATRYKLGLLINFNVTKLRDGVKRIVLT